MPTYRAYATVTGGKYLGEVEADTPEAAKEVAYGLDSADIGLCHACSSECEDAEVSDISVEEVKKSS